MRDAIVKAVEEAEDAREKEQEEWRLRQRAMRVGVCPECGGRGSRSIVRGRFFWSYARYEFHCSECTFVDSELLTD